jgi:hypothetical protein
MNKDEFLAGLKKSLKRLPPEDAADAVEYYEEYLEDAGQKTKPPPLAPGGLRSAWRRRSPPNTR